MRMLAKWIALGLALFGNIARADDSGRHDPPTVPYVDLSAYAGTWFEIARLPQIFEAGCAGVTATYTLRPDGRVRVENVCHKGGVDGRESSIRGVARAVDDTHAKLKVTFFWPFSGDYWVFALDAQYRFALVGGPDRKSLWILSRTSALDANTVQSLLALGQRLGFPVERMEFTEQAQ